MDRGTKVGFPDLPSNKSLKPTRDGAGRWRPRHCHPLGAPFELFAARTVIAVAVHAASRRGLGFFRWPNFTPRE